MQSFRSIKTITEQDKKYKEFEVNMWKAEELHFRTLKKNN